MQKKSSVVNAGEISKEDFETPPFYRCCTGSYQGLISKYKNMRLRETEGVIFMEISP